jgi:hypothetical protein
VNSLAGTVLSDRELLIHALQHLEVMTDQLAEVHEYVLKLDGELSVFRPLLARLAPGGKPDMLALMQTRREIRRGTRP